MTAETPNLQKAPESTKIFNWVKNKIQNLKDFFFRPHQNWEELKKTRTIKPWPIFIVEVVLVVSSLILLSYIFQDTLIKFSLQHKDIVEGSIWVYGPLFSLIFCLAFLYAKSKKQLIEPVEIALLVALCFFYQHYTLYPYSVKWCYASGIMLFVLITVAFPILQKLFAKITSPIEQTGYLVPDYDIGFISHNSQNGTKKSAIQIDYEDGLGFNLYAEEIARAVNIIRPNRAFSIGIDGDWGSGKSSLIALIKENLLSTSANKRKIKILDFKPWMFDNKQTLMESFFALWANEFYLNLELRSDLEKYVSIISNAEDNLFKSKLIQRIFEVEKDTIAIKKRLEKAIESSDCVYYFFIDDLDRVERHEVMDVIRLCKVLADFPNTIYFLAYDRKFIDSIIGEFVQDTVKQSEYFDKVIQVEFKVPMVTDQNLQDYFYRLL